MEPLTLETAIAQAEADIARINTVAPPAALFDDPDDDEEDEDDEEKKRGEDE